MTGILFAHLKGKVGVLMPVRDNPTGFVFMLHKSYAGRCDEQ